MWGSMLQQVRVVSPDVFSARFYCVNQYPSSIIYLHGIRFECLFREQIKHVKLEAGLTESTVIKVHANRADFRKNDFYCVVKSNG